MGHHSVYPGTRRWLDGQLLVSVGHPQLDAAAGGGVPLGSLVLLEQDAPLAAPAGAVHARTLSDLFLAEGIASGHHVVLCGFEPLPRLRRRLSRLPANASRDSKDLVATVRDGRDLLRGHPRRAVGSVGASEEAAGSQKEAEPETGADDTADTEQEEADEDTDEKDTDSAADDDASKWDKEGDNLKIAWQYKRYLSAPNPGTGSLTTKAKYGHTFDLSRCIHPRVLAEDASFELLSAADLSAEVEDRMLCTGAAGLAVGEPSESLPFEDVFYRDLLASLLPTLLKSESAPAHASSPDKPGRRGVVNRVLIDSLGTAVWPGRPAAGVGVGAGFTGWPGAIRDAEGVGQKASRQEDDPALLPAASAGAGAASASAAIVRFLAGLRRALELSRGDAMSVVLVSMPTQAFAPECAVLLRSLFDCVIKVHAFTDPPSCAAHARDVLASAVSTGAAPEFADYAGLVLLRKLPRLNALTNGFVPDTLTLAFKRDRKKMVIEKPYLPPEDDRTATNGAASAATASSTVTAATAALSSASALWPSGASLMQRAEAAGPTFGLQPESDEKFAPVSAGPIVPGDTSRGMGCTAGAASMGRNLHSVKVNSHLEF
jgi:hypothetical protein